MPENDITTGELSPDARLKVTLLGPVRCWMGDREVLLGTTQARAVFAMLAAQVGSALAPHELINGVWGEFAPNSANRVLQTYISRLRRALEPDHERGKSGLLQSASGGYRLVAARDQVDLFLFDDLRQDARRQMAAGDAEAAGRTLDAALALWSGEALFGVQGPYAEALRAKLAELHTSVMEDRAEASLARGLHDDAAALLTGLVRDHPFRDRPRALLMLALHRSGRTADALEAYRDARETYITELGVEPGSQLTEMHERILSQDASLTPHATRPAVAGTSSSKGRSPDPFPDVTVQAPSLVGREPELQAVHDAVRAAAEGTGRAIWIEGELGIGKSALIASALAAAERAGFEIAHAAADELGQRFPLRLMLDCLGVDLNATDERRAAISRALRLDAPDRAVVGSGAPYMWAIDSLVGFVEALCADGPVVLAVDDLQWADEASLEVWHRLCVKIHRLPLVLIGAARQVVPRPEVDRLRRDVELGGTTVVLQPLTESAIATMLEDLVGAEPGPGLALVTARASGNPLYVRELVDALRRDHLLLVADTTADVLPAYLDHAPRSLVSAVTGRMGFLSETARDLLRWAALLGTEFAVADLSVVLGKPVHTLVPALEEAIAAGVLEDAGQQLAFRHPLIRQALHQAMPGALRVALHNQVAEALARAGVSSDFVAGQLLAAGALGPWVVEWLADTAPELIHRAPQVAVDLLAQALQTASGRDSRRAEICAHMSTACLRLGRDAEAERHARAALLSLDDPWHIAEMRWTRAYIAYRASRVQAAELELTRALEDEALPDTWRARHLALLSLVQRACVGDLAVAESSAEEAVVLGEQVSDSFAVAQALEVRWQVAAVERRYEDALNHLDQALEAIGDDHTLTDLRLVVLDNRLFTLQCLDRLDDATETLAAAVDVAEHHDAPSAAVHISAAVHHFWLGQWDAATTGLERAWRDAQTTGFGLREGGPVLLMHGVASLIAAHRSDEAGMRRHLHAGLTLPTITLSDRENCDFLTMARATAEMRGGDLATAITLLKDLLDPRDGGMMLRHQWLPELVRIALVTGDTAVAEAAVEACEAEAAAETTPARAAAAARRCRAVVDRDPDALLAVADHYCSVGRRYELAQTLEDAAVVLHVAGDAGPADSVLRRALREYQSMAAGWDLERALARVGRGPGAATDIWTGSAA
jgi:DNA-binding SARP family transcriptional activator